MTTRREFVQSLPGAGAAFAVAGHMFLGESPARAQEPTPPKGHFNPQGKAPSKFTVEVIKQAKGKLPFADRKELEEQKKGFIAPMKDLKIKADAGHIAWDMERFQFLDSRRSSTASIPRFTASLS